MKQSREEHRKAMLAEAEALIGECMAWEDATEAPTMSQIEALVLGVRQKLGQRLAEEMLAQQEAAQPAEVPMYPRCGKVMADKGKKQVMVESRLGILRVRRVHYYCAHCERGLFPPG